MNRWKLNPHSFGLLPEVGPEGVFECKYMLYEESFLLESSKEWTIWHTGIKHGINLSKISYGGS